MFELGRRGIVVSVGCWVVAGFAGLASSACSESAADTSGETSSGGHAGAIASGGNGAGGSGAGNAGPVTPPERVVGYLPTYRNMDPGLIDLDVLTHLCIAFANPTGEGSESDFDVAARPRIAPLVTAAHDQGVKVLASIAGGTQVAGEAVGAQLVPENVDAYVASLVDLVSRYELDGIDVDIEGDAVTETYEPFVIKLRAALPEDKLLSTAVVTRNGADYSDEAIAEYDFVNIMAYDHCGWSETSCEHSALDATLDELDYWTEERGLGRDKVVFGVPFYGWCWGCAEKQTAMTYNQILFQYPQAKTEDFIVDGDVEISLNSAATIAIKAEHAKDYGGIMIWELGQDAKGEDSLLAVIADAQ